MNHFRKSYIMIVLMLMIVGAGIVYSENLVYIGGRQLDLKLRTSSATIAGARGHLIIQFTKPLSIAEKQKLTELEVILHQYLPVNAYFATVKKENLATVKSLDFVYGVGNIDPQDKLAYGIKKRLTMMGEQDKLAVIIYFYPDVTAEEKNKVYMKLSNDTCGSIGSKQQAVYLTKKQILELANEDAVYQLWLTPNPKIPFNRKAADTSDIDQIQPGGDAGYNLTGAGVILGEWDEGSVRATHYDFATSRVIQKDSPAGMSGHATHVAGTMVGNGATEPLTLGMAYEGTLWAYDWNNDFPELRSAALTIIASNHSYGYVRGWHPESGLFTTDWWWFGDTTVNLTEDYLFGKYIVESAEVDDIVYDTNIIVCRAAGNDRTDVGTSGAHYHGDEWPTPVHTFYCIHSSDAWDSGGFDTLEGIAVAKNVIVVGAVYYILADPFSTDSIRMTTFSSWGPPDDGRIKPDLCASGINVYSTYSTHDYAHLVNSGTSHATPVVTGTIGLLTQLYRQQHGALARPTAAEMKAILIHTAFEAGNTAGPDYRFGWGLLNGRGAADLLVANATTAINNKYIVNDTYFGSPKTYTRISDGTQPIKVTLVWTDPAGNANTGGLDDATPTLVNDLDLMVVTPSTTIRYPYQLDKTNPAKAATTLGPNHLDNVEQIVIDAPVEVGPYQIQVSHTGSLTGSQQDYTIIMTGFVQVTGVSWFELYE
ncbi:MAG: S8 family serine peptidase [bacterium]|nr:S8 family serine peptidase [bacterium]